VQIWCNQFWKFGFGFWSCFKSGVLDLVFDLSLDLCGWFCLCITTVLCS